MPILAREPDLYPDDLFDRPELGLEQAATWWALYVDGGPKLRRGGSVAAV